MHENILQILRLIKGYKQEEIAEVLSLPENIYGLLEMSSQKITIGQAKTLADFYNIDLEDVLPKKTGENKTSKVDKDDTQEYNELVSFMKKQIAFLEKLNVQLLYLIREQHSLKYQKRP